jgi:hypothetical protein
MIPAVIDTAKKLSIPPEWLHNLIRFESSFNPSILNPYTKAAGLIQFMPATARGLGYKDQYDLIKRHPTVDSQLSGPVLKYLSQYAPFPSEQSLYMAVFYPAYRSAPLDTLFPPHVRKVNPGINTIRDYICKVNPSFPPAMTIFPLAIAAVIAYFMLKT